MVKLREMKLPPPRPEDNCELSDAAELCEEDMDGEELPAPAWCDGFLEVLEAQTVIDPDTIFGASVPEVHLDSVFPSELWRRLGQEPPRRRKRGSSGNWSRDGVREEEVRRYKRHLGQTLAWDGTSVCEMPAPPAPPLRLRHGTRPVVSRSRT
jgi:hypothetical protein